MFDIDKGSLLNLLDAMGKTVENMDYDNPVEVSAFASSMVSIGNQINMGIVRDLNKKSE